MTETTIRKSEEKAVVDQKLHDNLLNKYIKIIDQLVSEYPVKTDLAFSKLVNFKKNKDIPIHRWFDYKQGYAEELVTRLIKTSGIAADQYVLDPFNGVGTTQVAAKSLGFNSIGTDINPVATLAAKVKTKNYNKEEIEEIKGCLTSIRDRYKTTSRIPKYKKLKDIFTPGQLDQILKIKGFYDSLPDGDVKNFFKLAFLSIIEDCSNRVKDGNGIKISRTKKAINDVFQFYEDKCNLMLSDINLDQANAKSKVIHGSILQDKVFEEVKKYPVGAVIFSPPYANCFDYLEVYKMEVWLGDFVDDYSDFSNYRDVALRSHVNSKFSNKIQHFNENVNTISSLIGTYNIWNKNIPSMLRGYFDDMSEMLKRLHEISNSGSLCAIVVANSGYKGVIVPTDLLLAQIGEAIGYEVENIILARDIRASSQQMKELKAQSNLMRESVILLRKR